MKRVMSLICAVFFAGIVPLQTRAEVTIVENPIEVSGPIKKPNNISALAIVGNRLVIGSDETSFVQLLEEKPNGYTVYGDGGKRPIILQPSGVGSAQEVEVDIEGIAADNNTIYVIGSHARVRPSGDNGKNKYKKNRANLDNPPSRFEKKKEFAARNTVARFELDSNGAAMNLENSSLKEVLDTTYPFKLFRDIPSKENGIDIEGLAVRDGKLYAGFRGPILRDNFVPILEFEFSKPIAHHRVLYVKLQGRGVRDMVAVKEGFLILAGPVGDGGQSYQIYLWNGEDIVCGENRPDAAKGLVLLGDVPMDTLGAKAEGITVISQSDSAYIVLMAFDGIENGGLQRYSVTRQGEVVLTCN